MNCVATVKASRYFRASENVAANASVVKLEPQGHLYLNYQKWSPPSI